MLRRAGPAGTKQGHRAATAAPTLDPQMTDHRDAITELTIPIALRPVRWHKDPWPEIHLKVAPSPSTQTTGMKEYGSC